MPGWFGLIRVRSPLLTESRLLSFPPGTEMFQFPGLATGTYGFSAGPFGHPGLNARLTAPPGLSQSSRPSLASGAQTIPHRPLLPGRLDSAPPGRVSPPGNRKPAFVSKPLPPPPPARGGESTDDP